MKKQQNNSNIRKVARELVLFIIGFAIIQHAYGQVTLSKTHDYLMPEKGKALIELYTGSPYIGVGQAYYGFSKNLSVGVICGITPVSTAYGVRMKAVIANPSDFWRINLKAPILYYPEKMQPDAEPWMLAWPTLNVERKLNNQSRFWIGAGVIGVSCVDDLFGKEEEHDESVEEESMNGLWNTFQFGYSKPLSQKSSFLIEVSPVMEGFKLKSKSGFLDAFPVIVTLGLSYSL